MAKVEIELKHDFTLKLRQPALISTVRNYIEWQKQVRSALSSGETPPDPPNWLGPFSINLDLTTQCTYRCPHCIDLDILDSGINYAHGQLMASLELLITKGMRSVILIGGGEPTAYKKFGEVVRFLKDRGIQLGIVSNGGQNKLLLDVVDCLTERDWIRLSLDAGTNETFIPMHKPKNKNLTLQEICSWVPRIRSVNSRVQIGFSFIVIWEQAKNMHGENILTNIDEIALAARLALNNNFSYISYKAFLERYSTGAEIMNPTITNNLDRTIERIKAGVDEARQYETKDFRVIESTNLKMIYDKTWYEFMRQPKTCHMQAFHAVLSPLGLFNCPAWRPKTIMELGLGHVAGSGAYMSEEATLGTQHAISLKLQGFDASKNCAGITCLYNSANWWLERAISGELDPDDLEALDERFDYFF